MLYISIHAPTRGATLNLLSHRQIFLFQSTLPQEERHLPHQAQSLCQPIFQSTLPREERPYLCHFYTSLNAYFNPRSHERSDCTVRNIFLLGTISIHAPTRGATEWSHQYTFRRFISIHAPTRGATG